MAPSPENDSAPKAPDKGSDKPRSDGPENIQKETCAVDGDSKDASVSRLDDRELKALLDEAINYKSPKDRQGKSRLFNNLLTEAEDDLRNARATSASGPQLARYYNQSASKRHRNRRQASSISENLTHGGSLNNLAKEELYEAAIHLQKPKKTVSARQREGGSLPCNVNVGASYDRQFFEEARNKEKEKSKAICPIEMESERILDHELLITSDIDSDFRLTSKYSKNAKPHEPCVTALALPTLEKAPKIIDNDYPRTVNYEPFSKLNESLPVFSYRRDDKKVDENCNALGLGSNQKKKFKKKPIEERNVTVITSGEIPGHRSDIVNDLQKVIDFIDGKARKLKRKKKIKNIVDDGINNRKHRPRSKGKGCSTLQKSSSLEEMTTTKLEDFEFLPADGKVALRQTKSSADKPRERRSLGNSEQIQVQSLYNVSMENLETADFHVVMKKKKCKKRRSSLSSRRPAYTREEHVEEFNRVPSPEPRRKSAISVPHSEKSNDSSDVDSVHSLPIDTNRMNIDTEDEDAVNFPISYADIAKNTANQLDKLKWNNRSNGEKKKTNDKNIPTSPDSDGFKNDVFIDSKLPSKNSIPEDKGKSVNKQQTIVSSNNSPPQQLQVVPKTQDKATSAPEEKPQIPPPVTTKENSPELNLVNYMVNFPSIPSKEKSPPNDYQQKFVKNIVAEIQNWPAIPSNNNHYNVNNNRGYDKNNTKNQQKIQRNLANHYKNAKNVAMQRHDKQQQANMGHNNAKIQNIIYANEAQQINFQMIQNQERAMNAIYTHQNMPLNIQDVRTIEKQFKNQPKPIFFHNHFFCQFQRYPPHEEPLPLPPPPPHHIHHHHHSHRLRHHQQQQPLLPPKEMSPLPPRINANYPVDNNANGIIVNNGVQCDADFANGGGDMMAGCSDCDRTTNDSSNDNSNTNGNNSSNSSGNSSCNRPAVVILSGSGDKEVSGITFGFDINEQLLSDDVCADFVARFVPPKDCNVANGFNLDKIVNFIGVAWEDTIRETNGQSVKYYTEEL